MVVIRYCSKCGSRLRAIKESAGYATATGAGSWKIRVWCPNRSFPWDGHTRDFIKYQNTNDAFYFDDAALEQTLKLYLGE